MLKFTRPREFIAPRRKLPVVIEKRLLKERGGDFSVFTPASAIYFLQELISLERERGESEREREGGGEATATRETYYLATLRGLPINRKSRISSVTNLLR